MGEGKWEGPELHCPRCEKDVAPSVEFYAPRQYRDGASNAERLDAMKVRLLCPECGEKMAAVKGFYPLGFHL